MSVITNLVVAMMIVTNGMQKVQGRVIPDSDCCVSQYIISLGGPIEELYRKTSTTNFVFGGAIIEAENLMHREWVYECGFVKNIKEVPIPIERVYKMRPVSCWWQFE